MSAIPERRRKRFITAVTMSVVSAVALPSGVLVGSNLLLNTSGGKGVTNTDIEIPRTPVELLAVTSSRNEVAALALIAVDPSGAGGTIVSIPVGSAADVSEGEPLRRIVDNFATGGLASVRAEVEDLTNITVDLAAQVNAAELGTLLANIGTQPVSLLQSVQDTNMDGTTATVLDRGEITASAAQIAAAIAAVPAGVPELQRLLQVKALWTAVSRAGVAGSVTTGSGTTTIPSNVTTTTNMLGGAGVDAPTTSEGFLQMLFAGRVDVWQLDASLITDPARNPAALDMYSLDSGEVLTVMASVAPGALSLASNNITLMVDVPFADFNVAKEAVTRLAFLEANVVLVRRTAEPPVEKTVAYYTDLNARLEVEDFSSLVGPIEFAETTESIAGVAVRIVLGNDFVSFIGNGSVVSTTTTVAG